MAEYQVFARKYRPQQFKEVLGQEAIVTTLKNAIKFKRLAHAYLFCGSRGTGKTTLARVFAKALNCQAPTDELEPCGQCSSCKEIAAGCSLDVLEIDGASHRGIDDIRQINETVGYASSSGKYKIYIIDEVHMLTKEAFNALLKTLEEPPPKVKFFFATTEPHKVLPTILSRCQRFNLNRIPTEKIIDKLQRIALDLGVKIDDEAVRILAKHADGGLRDAESLFDQIHAFHEGDISAEAVSSILGIMPRDSLFELDRAGKEGNLALAFEIANQVFSQGKDVGHFLEQIIEHFRILLLIKLAGKDAPYLSLPESEKERYAASSGLYSQEQCTSILDFLIESQQQFRYQHSGKIALEALLLRIMRTHQRLPIEVLVRRLAELEQAFASGTPGEAAQPPQQAQQQPAQLQQQAQVQQPQQVQQQLYQQQQKQTQPSAPSPSPIIPTPRPAPQPVPAKPIQEPLSSMSIDPTPSPADLGIKIAPPKIDANKQSRHDTILQFAAVELEGTIQKNRS